METAMETIPSSEVEVIDEHCHVYRLYDDKMTLVVLSGTSRKTIEAWIDFSAEMRRTWDRDEPMYIMVDMSQVDFSFGNFASKKAMEMLKINMEAVTYIAWITKDSLLGNLWRTTLNYANIMSRTIKFQLVHQYDDGLNWLVKQGLEIPD